MEDSKSKEEEKEFICSNCNFKAKYNYHGTKPPFLKSLILLEEAYVMKDPFSTEGGLVTLGAQCSLCNKPVCIATDCSLFFTKRFCLGCVTDHLDEFPKEIRQACSWCRAGQRRPSQVGDLSLRRKH
ncbi:cysteine-rich DPF motif domain-containing protein 1-like isoform X1 [Haliotis rubra]|uniref:cysteine-rich DPF motif domain-containing protein 1-like isoform X1 n=1 Tax=Haliotis rubra TaxID=36100 RepID=UPI001EE5A9F9|nr:cysteine-rich DPF motif domain-containing protein 1-like isoform X1 [Haliotis rubra]